VLPASVISSLEQSNKIVLSTAIIPGEQDLVDALNNVTLSVTASTTGDFVQAVDQVRPPILSWRIVLTEAGHAMLPKGDGGGRRLRCFD
jgi:hypothetical protein